MTRAAELLRLQVADEHVATLGSEVAVLESLLRRDPELETRRARSREASSAGMQAAEQLATAEEELAVLERRTKTLDRKLYDGSVHNPNELIEMQRELDVLRGQVAEAEDRLLTLIDSSEAAVKNADDAGQVVAEIERRRAEEERPRRQRLGELRARLVEAQQGRDAVAASVGAADLALYARVASRHHPAVVGIKGDQCAGCHLPLSNEERRAVRAGDGIVQCSSCDRILVP